jgi:hypothetical protein
VKVLAAKALAAATRKTRKVKALVGVPSEDPYT